MIRRAKMGDGPGIHVAHMESICEVCAPFYTPEEIMAWGGREYNSKKWDQAITEHYVWIVEVNGKIEGHAHLKIIQDVGLGIVEEESNFGKCGYIGSFYLTKNILGKSYGKYLMEEIFKIAKVEKIHLLTCEATINARPFYKKMGFVEVGGEKKVEVNGVLVRCYPMKYDLK